MKVDFSSGGCEELPNWMKITDQNADVLQLVSKMLLQQVLTIDLQLILQLTGARHCSGSYKTRRNPAHQQTRP